jgi:hypothetical protein
MDIIATTFDIVFLNSTILSFLKCVALTPEAAQRLALAAWGGSVDSPPKRRKLKAMKTLKKRGAYPKSAARIVEHGLEDSSLGCCEPSRRS